MSESYVCLVMIYWLFDAGEVAQKRCVLCVFYILFFDNLAQYFIEAISDGRDFVLTQKKNVSLLSGFEKRGFLFPCLGYWNVYYVMKGL